MNTGHEGSMTTIHANTPRDALSRLENMISMASASMPPRAVRQQMAAAISVVVQTLRLIDGRRKITSIQEITGMEGEVISLQQIFGFRQIGVGSDGAVLGHFAATGVRPKIMERLQSFGVQLPDAMFDPAYLLETI
jgi:pilus assembly protein CpaF